MNTRNDKYDASNVMKRFINLINSINSIGYTDTIIGKIKLLYYTKIKYPIFRRYIMNIIKNDSKMIIEDPTKLIKITMEFIIYIVEYCKYTKISVDKLMKSLYHNNENSISLYYDIINPSLLNKIVIISKLHSKKRKKVIVTKYRIDMKVYTCELEQTIYDCDDYDSTSTASIDFHRIYKIDTNGNLYNPNYIFDSSIRDEEYRQYGVMALTISRIFFDILFHTARIQVKERIVK